jgi:hypothetical protein
MSMHEEQRPLGQQFGNGLAVKMRAGTAIKISPMSQAQKRAQTPATPKPRPMSVHGSMSGTSSPVHMSPTIRPRAQTSMQGTPVQRRRPLSYHQGVSEYDMQMQGGYASPRVHARGSSMGMYYAPPVAVAEPLGSRDPAMETRSFSKRLVELDDYYGIGKLG